MEGVGFVVVEAKGVAGWVVEGLEIVVVCWEVDGQGEVVMAKVVVEFVRMGWVRAVVEYEVAVKVMEVLMVAVAVVVVLEMVVATVVQVKVDFMTL